MKKVFSVLVSLVFCIFIGSILSAQATVVHDGKTLKINCNNPTASVNVNVALSSAGIPEGGAYIYVPANDTSTDLSVPGGIVFNGSGGGFGSPPPSGVNVSLSSSGQSICDDLAPGESTSRSLTMAPTVDTLASGNFIAFTVDIVICKDAEDDDSTSDDDSRDRGFQDNIEDVDIGEFTLIDFNVAEDNPLILETVFKLKNVNPIVGGPLVTDGTDLAGLTKTGEDFIKAMDNLGTAKIKLSRVGQLKEARRKKRQVIKDATKQAKSEGKSKSEIKEAVQMAVDEYESSGLGRVVKEIDLKTLAGFKDKAAPTKKEKQERRKNILRTVKIESGGTVTLDESGKICVPVKLTFDATLCPVKGKSARKLARKLMQMGKAALLPGETVSAGYPIRFVGFLQDFTGGTAKNGRRNGKVEPILTIKNGEATEE